MRKPVPVEESQKPMSEKPVGIPSKDTINPEPRMPRGKDTIMGDPTPTEIAAKLRDMLIKQRSKNTLKSVKDKYSNGPINPPMT
jgi:hypothetical protein